jgi:hypothetical protein
VDEATFTISSPTVKVTHRLQVIVENPTQKAVLYAIHRLNKVIGQP